MSTWTTTSCTWFSSSWMKTWGRTWGTWMSTKSTIHAYRRCSYLKPEYYLVHEWQNRSCKLEVEDTSQKLMRKLELSWDCCWKDRRSSWKTHREMNWLPLTILQFSSVHYCINCLLCVKVILYQILQGVLYLHDRKYVHFLSKYNCWSLQKKVCCWAHSLPGSLTETIFYKQLHVLAGCLSCCYWNCYLHRNSMLCNNNHWLKSMLEKFFDWNLNGVLWLWHSQSISQGS